MFDPTKELVEFLDGGYALFHVDEDGETLATREREDGYEVESCPVDEEEDMVRRFKTQRGY